MPDFAVSAVFGAKGAEFLGTMRTMRSAVSSFATSARSAFERAIPGGRALSSVFHSLAGQVAIGNLMSRGISAIGRGIAELPGQLEDFAARGQEIGRTASIIGTTADNFQRLAYAAKLTDTPVESLQNSMQKLNKNMADWTVGKGSLKDLARYGPPGLAKMIRGTHDTTEAMFLLADSIAKTRDPQVRAAIAVSAFGRAGQEMLPFLSRGRAGLQALMKEADKYSYIMGDNAVKASGNFDDNLSRVRGTLDSLKGTLMETVLYAVTPYLEKARDWLANNQEMIKQRIPEYIDKIRDAALWLVGAVEKVHDTWKRLDAMANGHLFRDIMLVYGAWKSVRLAIDLAKAAQIAFNIVSAATGAGGAAGAGAVAVRGAAETAIGAGAAKWAGKWGAAGAVGKGMLGGAAAGSLVGLAAAATIWSAVTAAKGLAPVMSKPTEFLHAAGTGQEMQGGNFLTNLFTGAYRLGSGLRGSKYKDTGVAPTAATPGSTASQRVAVDVFLKWLGDNRGVLAITGNPGAQYGVTQ